MTRPRRFGAVSAVLGLVSGNGRDDAMSAAEVSEILAIDLKYAQQMLLKLATEGGLARTLEPGAPNGRRRAWLYYDPQADAGETPGVDIDAGHQAPPQVAPAEHVERVAPAREPARPMARAGNAAGVSRRPAPTRPIEFALWSDGRLDIVEGDEMLQLPPSAVARLALLLGVPNALSQLTNTTGV